MITLRPYQQEAVDALWANMDKHVLVSIPTGGGKSAILSELIRRCLEFPNTHILLMTHTRELIRQNARHLEEHLPPHIEIGIFCAGLREKRQKQVTIASVQSIVRAKEMLPFEIIIIDECHLVSEDTESQYHKVFARFPEARICGLTATPYRMKTGLLHEGDNALFECLAYEAKTGDLIREGWLSPIRARAVSEHADLSEVHLRGGEFKNDEMIRAMDHDNITKAAVQDVLNHAADRKSILVFCAGIEHAEHVRQAFVDVGQTSVAVVTQETPLWQRDETVQNFKHGTLRILINCAVFTTGFDYPGVDCVVMLRATKSPGLYVQCVGRGLRKAAGKTNCLLLDYGGNIELHGSLDMITSKRHPEGEAVVKTCPQCQSVVYAGFAVCPECGFIFPVNKKEAPKHGTEASELDPIAPTVIKVWDVKDVVYRRHSKSGKPDSIRVEYGIGLFETVKEWVCPEHGGYATKKASEFFARRGKVMPKTTEECLKVCHELLKPVKITTRRNGEHQEVISYQWGK